MLGAAPLAAHEDNPVFEPACTANSASAETTSTIVVRKAAWQCGQDRWEAGEVSWLKFDAADWRDKRNPSSFLTRISRFETIEISAIDRDGTTRSASYTPNEATPVAAGPVFAVPLPELGSDTETIIVKIEGPHSVTMLSEARLVSSLEHAGWTQADVMLLALIAGLLIAPLLFDINFYIVLKEPFVLLHAVMVVAMIGYVMFAGGLITVFAILPITLMAIAAPLLWAIGVACAAFFMVSFVEDDALHPLMRRALIATGCWTMLVPGFFSLQLTSTQAFDDQFYFYSFIPVIAIYTASLLQALYNGSRSAWFLAIAWLPIIAAACERLLRGLGLYSAPSSADQLLFVGLGAEVVIIAIGVADRFLSVRRQRDKALTAAEMLEELSERDPLTGLMNRRAIEQRFTDLRRAGYGAFALIDLDKFKDINDRFGHNKGDEVLRSVGQALKADGETFAIRMGGEEFLLLLRGEGAIDRAEQRRQAIALRIARDIDGLDRVVTASMGVIEAPLAALPNATFEDIYRRADSLLYEAKEAGRNRTASETLRAFRRSGNDRPKQAVA